ncbi:amino acid aminotransferase [Pararhodobacter sp.]|uniref:amino acid aminotransferase n=1 Tax=Pararhodobacter sp. TaxID=2127056 RepID=UPI002FDEC44B
MFNNLTPPPPDAILKVMQQFRDDPRSDKVDLGVGVYRDATGVTPVMRAVKAAEAHLVATQDSKGYVAMAGDTAFHSAMAALVLGGVVGAERIAAAAATGGTGAVRQAMELIHTANPQARVWISQPTWPNHPALAEAAGLEWRPYRYYDAENGGIDRAGMMADLDGAREGDVILLHGCCHNPTGADFTESDWADIAAFLERRGLIPFVDIAYQGFGDGVDADAAGLRHLAARLPRLMIAGSAAKNFGLYRERAGIYMVVCPPAERDTTQAMMAWLNRSSTGFPPDHGARVVTTILNDPMMKDQWLQELAEMRARVNGLRAALATALRKETGSDRFGFLGAQKGMFSLLGGTDAQIARLREEFGLYLVGGGRMNIAGLKEDTVDRVAAGIARVLND